VARDVVRCCEPDEGLWVDLGCGAGPLSRALARRTKSVFVLVDPDAEALSHTLEQAGKSGLKNRFVPVVGVAESIPLADASADLVVSRGSIFFWNDRPAGLREVYRILRPGAKTMIGGGLGSSYPRWAKEEFIRRRRGGVRKQGPEAARAFREARSPETFTRWAQDAGLTNFEVIREGGLSAEDPRSGLGIWLLFGKETQ